MMRPGERGVDAYVYERARVIRFSLNFEVMRALSLYSDVCSEEFMCAVFIVMCAVKRAIHQRRPPLSPCVTFTFYTRM